VPDAGTVFQPGWALLLSWLERSPVVTQTMPAGLACSATEASQAGGAVGDAAHVVIAWPPAIRSSP